MKRENLIKRIKKEVEAMKPTETSEAKSYFRYWWDKLTKKPDEIEKYYKNMKHRLFFPR